MVVPAAVNLTFRCGLSPSDPDTVPVLIVGQLRNLKKISYNDVKCKLEARVSIEAWTKAITALASGSESCEVWPRSATVFALPPRCERHSAPSRPHALSDAVKSAPRGTNEAVVVVCEKSDVYASSCAVARSYPLFSRRSKIGLSQSVTAAQTDNGSPQPLQVGNVSIEFLLVQPDAAMGDSSEQANPYDPYLLDTQLSLDDLEVLRNAAESVRLAALITDTPTNEMNVDHFIEQAKKLAADLQLPPPTIIRGKELEERGFGGIYGVGKAAAVPPALVTLSWTPAGATETIAWVGKGIVYDTGGLSIKSKTTMPGMKTDCAGAAGVLSAFGAFVKSRPSVNLHAVLCLAENSVGPNSTRPDDIHKLYSGRTVEINNTDAEGRLVLADGVVWAARDLRANVLLDMATLTGAQGIATGKYHAGVLSNRGAWERAAVAAGRLAGDLAFALPYAPDLHFKEFASDIADMKNSVADRHNAQPSCAGLFIMAHLGFDFPGAWVHVDMAAPATSGERATGYGVALLSVLFGCYTQSQLLRALCPISAPGDAVSPSNKKQRIK